MGETLEGLGSTTTRPFGGFARKPTGRRKRKSPLQHLFDTESMLLRSRMSPNRNELQTMQFDKLGVHTGMQ